VPANDLAHQPLVSQALKTTALPVANAQGMDDGQVSRVTRGQEGMFDCTEQGIGFQQRSRTANRHSGAIGNARSDICGRRTASSHFCFLPKVSLFASPVHRTLDVLSKDALNK
jgi:hypothetical protein